MEMYCSFPSSILSNTRLSLQNNIQQVFQRLHALLQEEYSGEDLQIIACPSMEQVSPTVKQNLAQGILSRFNTQQRWPLDLKVFFQCRTSHILVKIIGESVPFSPPSQINLQLSVNK